jgi:hypothetical protein
VTKDFHAILEAQRKAQHNAKADVFSLGPTITIAVEVRDLPVDARRTMFNTLLCDREMNPGIESMPVDEAREMFRLLDKYCGWNKPQKG